MARQRTAAMQSPYREGFDAGYFKNASVTDNPYMPDTDQAREWHDGWAKAQTMPRPDRHPGATEQS